MEQEPELTEAGRPRVPRPMPDTSDATHCPHCGVEVGGGHMVCWNCSRDIRMKEHTEEEILAEYQVMLARGEVRLEQRNLRFFGSLALLALGGAGLWAFLAPHQWGMIVIFVLLAGLMTRFAVKAWRRAARIRHTHAL